jgi:hypothetical protein
MRFSNLYPISLCNSVKSLLIQAVADATGEDCVPRLYSDIAIKQLQPCDFPLGSSAR